MPEVIDRRTVEEHVPLCEVGAKEGHVEVSVLGRIRFLIHGAKQGNHEWSEEFSVENGYAQGGKLTIKGSSAGRETAEERINCPCRRVAFGDLEMFTHIPVGGLEDREQGRRREERLSVVAPKGVNGVGEAHLEMIAYVFEKGVHPRRRGRWSNGAEERKKNL